MKETENLMKGSVHKDDLFIIHDALVLMTAKETIEWMKEKNYFHRWLLPMNGLQDGTPYDERPVVNSPEFMPLDNSLNCRTSRQNSSGSWLWLRLSFWIILCLGLWL